MTADARVEELLEELLDSGGTPEEVCRSCPELLTEVHAGWQRLRALEAEVGALFPESTPGDGATPVNAVANSRKVTQSTEVAASDHVALVDGHIGEQATAAKVVEATRSRFQSIDVLANNAGIFFTKPFTDYTAEDFKSLVSTNLEGFLYVTQLAVAGVLHGSLANSARVEYCS
jgi:NAD(P)-dependent dehydrogenase (short-subunit alcohol dehydrogenase family)